jgi:hypothetical protein
MLQLAAMRYRGNRARLERAGLGGNAECVGATGSAFAAQNISSLHKMRQTKLIDI